MLHPFVLCFIMGQVLYMMPRPVLRKVFVSHMPASRCLPNHHRHAPMHSTTHHRSDSTDRHPHSHSCPHAHTRPHSYQRPCTSCLVLRPAFIVPAILAMAALLFCMWFSSFRSIGADFASSLSLDIAKQSRSESILANIDSTPSQIDFLGQTFTVAHTQDNSSDAAASQAASLPDIYDALVAASASGTSDNDFLAATGSDSTWGWGDSSSSSSLSSSSSVWESNDYTVKPPLYADISSEPLDFDLGGIPAHFESVLHDWSSADYISAVSVLPSALLSSLAEHGWSVHITNRPIDELFPVGWCTDVENIAGICWVPTKEIWLDAGCSPKHVLVHEIGHAIDWESGGASINEEWNHAMDAVSDTSSANASLHKTWDDMFFGDIETTHACNYICSRERFFEQYANAFETYWSSPARLLYECPEMYVYFAERFGVASDMSEDALLFHYEEGREAMANPMTLDVDDIMYEPEEGEEVDGKASYVSAIEWLNWMMDSVPLYS